MESKNQTRKVWVVRGRRDVPAAPVTMYFFSNGVEAHFETEEDAKAHWASHEALPEFCAGDHVYLCVDIIDLTCTGCASALDSVYVWVCRTAGVGECEPSYFEDGVECNFPTRQEAVAFLESWDDTESEIVRCHTFDVARQEVTL